MFKEIRLKKRALTKEECIEILKAQNFGVLSLIGNEGYPYGVPLSYAYKDGVIHLHGALKGHKIDSIMNEPKACFTIVTKNDLAPDEFSTNYESVILFGKVRILTSEEEKRASFMELIDHISYDYIEEGKAYIEKMMRATASIEFKIEHMTGKARK